MMAPNPSGGAVLGGHHPAVIPRTITGITRTTARKPCPAARAAGVVRSFEMATRDISIAMKNNRMRPGQSMSQINRCVALNKFTLFKRKMATALIVSMRYRRQASLQRRLRLSSRRTDARKPGVMTKFCEGGRMGPRTEVVVAGGGPVGLAAAIAIRGKGFGVTVADGVNPPIDKACGEGLMPNTIAALRTLGVVVRDADGYAFRGIRFVEGRSNVDASFPGGQGIGVRRTVLHQKLAERAKACGISLLWNTPVTGICAEGVAVKGGVVRAKWIIGADGSASRVRKWAGLDAHREHKRRFAIRRHYRVKPWTDCVEIYWGPNAQAYVTAVGKEEVCVVIILRKPDVHLEMAMRQFPELALRLDGAEPASADRGAVTAMHNLNRVYRGRVALIGDASGGVDAITGEGLGLGFQQAGALAEALQADDLEAYNTAHRRLARRPRLMARLLLLLDGQPALRRRVLRALSGEPKIFERLLAMHAGETSPGRLAATGARLGWRFLAA